MLLLFAPVCVARAVVLFVAKRFKEISKLFVFVFVF